MYGKKKGADDVISRNQRFEIRLSERDMQKIKTNAKRTNLNASQFARRALIGEIVQETKSIDYYALYNEINKTGVNINQMSKIANTSKNLEETSMSQILYLLIKICNLIDEGVE